MRTSFVLLLALGLLGASTQLYAQNFESVENQQMYKSTSLFVDIEINNMNVGDTLTLDASVNLPYARIWDGSALVMSHSLELIYPVTDTTIEFRSYIFTNTTTVSLSLKDEDDTEIDTESFTIEVIETPPSFTTLVYGTTPYDAFDVITETPDFSGMLTANRSNGTLNGDTTIVTSAQGLITIDSVLMDSDRIPSGMGSDIFLSGNTSNGLDTLKILVYRKSDTSLRDSTYIVFDLQNFRMVDGDQSGTTNEEVSFTRRLRIRGTNSSHTNSVTITSSQNKFETLRVDSTSYTSDTASVYLYALPKTNVIGHDTLTVLFEDETISDALITTLPIEILNVNDPPKFSFSSTSLFSGDTLTVYEDFLDSPVVTLSFDHPDNENDQTLSITSSVLSNEYTSYTLSVESTDTTVVFSSESNLFGLQTIVFTADDQQSLYNTYLDTLYINVLPKNDPPVFSLSQDSVERDEDFQDTIRVSVTPTTVFGEGNQQVRYSFVGETPDFLNMSIDSLSGDIGITSVPNKDYSTIMYIQADDQQSDNNLWIDTLTITIHSVNDRPVAVADTFYLDEDSPSTAWRLNGVLANDFDVDSHPDSLYAVLVDSVESFQAFVFDPDGGFVFLPPQDFYGELPFTYTISDGLDWSDTVTAVFIVEPVNDPPIAVRDTFTIEENEYFIISKTECLENDTDIDTDHGILSLEVLTEPTNGRFYNLSNVLFFIPTRDWSGIDFMTYRVSDGELFDTTTVVFEVLNINNPPEGIADFFTLEEGQTITGNVLDNDSDIDGDAIEAYSSVTTRHGVLQLQVHGDFSYTPDEYYFGADTLVYYPHDGDADGNMTLAIFTITPVENPNPFALSSDTIYLRPQDTLSVFIQDEVVPFGEDSTETFTVSQTQFSQPTLLDRQIQIIGLDEGTESLIVTGDQYSDTLLIVCRYDSHTIHFTQGWNMFSTFVRPADNVLDSIFADKRDSLLLVKNGRGHVYIPQYNIDQIDSLYYQGGYLLYALNDFDLDIKGWNIVPETQPIYLRTGWNIISFLRQNPIDIERALAQVDMNMLITKNGGGAVYIPQYRINTIGNMTPGEGYQIYMQYPDTLYYPENRIMKTFAGSIPRPDINPDLALSDSSMTLILIFEAEDLNGRDVLVRTESGTIVGTGIVHNDKATITVWGDDSQTDDVFGALEGESLVLEDFETGIAFTLREVLDATNNNQTNLHYQNNSVLKVFVDELNNVFLSSSSEIDLITTPNPAVELATLSFTGNNSDADVLIVNLQGRSVYKTTLFATGNTKHSLDVSAFTPGKYFIFVTMGDCVLRTSFHVIH